MCSEEGVCETLECLTSVGCEDYQTCSEDSVCVDNPPTIVPRRVDALALLSPNFYVPEIQACTSLTEVVNPMLNSMVSEADENGDYDVSIVFEQVDKVSNTQTGKLHLSLLDCSEGVQDPESPNAPLDVCVEDLAARLATSTHNKRDSDGVCFARIPEDADADGYFNVPENAIDPSDIPTAEAPDSQVENSVGTGCFATDAQSPLELNLSGIVLKLNHYTTAAQYALPMVDNSEVGILHGFLTAADAKETILPESLPLVGGKPLSSLFANGYGGCTDLARGLDKGPNAAGELEDGWWLQIGYTARIVEIVPAP